MGTKTQGLNSVSILFCPVVDCKSGHNPPRPPPPPSPSTRLEEISSHVLRALICSYSKKLFSLHLSKCISETRPPSSCAWSAITLLLSTAISRMVVGGSTRAWKRIRNLFQFDFHYSSKNLRLSWVFFFLSFRPQLSFSTHEVSL